MSLWIESGQPVSLRSRREGKETDRKRWSSPAIGKTIREKGHSQRARDENGTGSLSL